MAFYPSCFAQEFYLEKLNVYITSQINADSCGGRNSHKLKTKLSEIVDTKTPKIGTEDDFTLNLDKTNNKFVQLPGVDFPKAFDHLQPPTDI